MRAVSLRAVDAHNVDAVRALAPHEAQQRFIAGNAESLELAAGHAHMHARAIYAGDVLVGFALYAEAGQAGRQDTHVLYRLMIAAGEQGRGHGRRALALLQGEMRARGAARVAFCITRRTTSWPGNCMHPPALWRRASTRMAR